jgi:DDE superfamily endonuclease
MAGVRGGVHAGRDGRAAAPARVERAGPGPPGRRAGRGRDRQVAGGDLARGKRTAADLGAWVCFEDESGQGLRPPKGRTWGRRGRTPVVGVTGGSNKRVSLAALIADRPGQRPRLIYRVHAGRHAPGDMRKGFTEADYARLLDAAHQQLGGPIVVVWDNLNTHRSRAMRELADAVPAWPHRRLPRQDRTRPHALVALAVEGHVHGWARPPPRVIRAAGLIPASGASSIASPPGFLTSRLRCKVTGAVLVPGRARSARARSGPGTGVRRPEPGQRRRGVSAEVARLRLGPPAR